MSIQILGKHGDRTEVLDDADNKKQATEQVNYWRNLKGKGWKVFSKEKIRLDRKVKVLYN